MNQNSNTYGKIVKEDDLEVHVRVLKIRKSILVDIRDYVPSLDTYGRGVMFDAKSLGPIIDALDEIEDEYN